MPETLTPEIVRIAYLLFFCRPPESQAVIDYSLGFGTLERLGEAFRNSVEFEITLDRRPRLVPADAPPLPVDWRVDDATALALLARLRAAWRGVPPGPPGDAGAVRDPSGEQQLAELLGCLHRARVDPARLAGVFEFGCGSGRVLRHLAAHFGGAEGCDLSPARLAGNAVPVTDLSFGMRQPFDLWYSYLTLQSYPPPLIGRILARALGLLRPGGVAVFQLPTYARGYTFDPGAEPRADPSLDRHILPQVDVLDIADAAGCRIAEAFEDLAVPPHPFWRSTVYVMRKRGG
jgi:SAM-dependent methyltransferase